MWPFALTSTQRLAAAERQADREAFLAAIDAMKEVAVAQSKATEALYASFHTAATPEPRPFSEEELWREEQERLVPVADPFAGLFESEIN